LLCLGLRLPGIPFLKMGGRFAVQILVLYFIYSFFFFLSFPLFSGEGWVSLVYSHIRVKRFGVVVFCM
jgi:hypothetical protein